MPKEASSRAKAPARSRKTAMRSGAMPSDLIGPSEKVAKQAMKQTAYNDIELDRWKEYDDVMTDSLWLFNGRDKTDGHQLDYHGNCVPQILTQMMKRYTKQNDVVVDFFLGSGTTAIEAHRLNRRCIGIELQSHMVDYVTDKLADLGVSESTHQVMQADSSDVIWTGKKLQKALKHFGTESAQFAFLHPPYADIIQFSESQQCLSNAQSTEAFLDMFQNVAQLAYNTLEKGRFAAVVIGDKYANSEWVPLGFYCMDRMNRVGFKTKSVVVKNMTGNERGKGRTTNLWRYRALMGGFYLFKHEYVLIFQKP